MPSNPLSRSGSGVDARRWLNPRQPTEHVRRAQVREDQTLDRGQADEYPTLVGDPRQADERVTQKKAADDSDPHSDATGEGIGTLHDYLLR
jgi:hypothetical protein